MTHYSNIRKLSAFHICDFGEARAYHDAKVLDGYRALSKSLLLEPMPEHLGKFSNWMPYFRLVDGPAEPVHVLIRLGPNTTESEGDEWLKNERRLPWIWVKSVLLPAILLLPESTRTRLNNTAQTTETTGVLPSYVRIYKEDLELLDSAVGAAYATSGITNLSWCYIVCKFGQQLMLMDGEVLGPESFRLGAMFQVDLLDMVSVHLALNFSSVNEEEEYDVFWDRPKLNTWASGECIIYPLCTLT